MSRRLLLEYGGIPEVPLGQINSKTPCRSGKIPERKGRFSSVSAQPGSESNFLFSLSRAFETELLFFSRKEATEPGPV